MDRRTIRVADLVRGDIPDDLTGVKWRLGTVECRANVTAEDYGLRSRAAGRGLDELGEIVTDAAAHCDICADKCG